MQAMQLGFLQKKQVHFFFKIYNCTTLGATIHLGFNYICMFPNFMD